MSLLTLHGKPTLSEFRLRALVKRLQPILPAAHLQAISASQVYILESEIPLNAVQIATARDLLDAGEPIAGAVDGFYVAPRRGTISPWSSKASDIFHNCGLSIVRRVEHATLYQVTEASGRVIPAEQLRPAFDLLHDRMTEGVYTDLEGHFHHQEPALLKCVDILTGGIDALRHANSTWGLALSNDEIEYLFHAYSAIRRNPTDVELVMFGQVNSEHCRHKIFRAEWIIDGLSHATGLFDMIRHTHARHPAGTILAYSDNSGVIEGFRDEWFEVEPGHAFRYAYHPDQIDILMKVETHNHPTAISPYPGAATGVGGEIRDEGATGIGGRTKAGLSGFMVSNLRVPNFIMPWERQHAEFPGRLASPLAIMLEGPIGGARFGNEFGRPQLTGFFRTYEERHNDRYRGYHKPIMLAGGMGNIKRIHAHKHPLSSGACVIQLGGPAMRIGLGGGAASSMASGQNAENLDFDSVQRDNAEIQRRCQEVINACIALGLHNPIRSIHDIGAGGLSNGCPELISETGGRFWLRKIPNEEKAMSPMEIWCCEAQERYVLAISRDDLDGFMALCSRERCPAHVIGEATGDGHLTLIDDFFGNNPIDIELQVILGKPPKMVRDVSHRTETHAPVDLDEITLADAVERVLRLPAVANKTFLITITDRTITGMVARDQMAGPYQTPISDVAVTTTSLKSFTGEAMAIGERTPIAVVNAPASGRMAIGEALTNIAAAAIGPIGRVKLSANWMCACGEEGEDANLYDTVWSVGMELCPALGISIPVGKDSLSMRTVWTTSTGTSEKIVSPLSLIVSAFAPVEEVRHCVTPDLKPGTGSLLLLLDLGRRQNRLGGSALTQVYNQVGAITPDLDDPALMVSYFNAIQQMLKEELLLAYHDRSDGGLFVTVAEMCFGGRIGVSITLDELGEEPLAILFTEELGGVIQVADKHLDRVNAILNEHGLGEIATILGSPTTDGSLTVEFANSVIYKAQLMELHRTWSELTHHMQSLRDNPECARQEFDNLLETNDPGIQYKLTYNPNTAFIIGTHRPRMAILREQGINGQVEMAAAFDRAGFESTDIHMTDLLGGRVDLKNFAGLVACGGFSYGDVLGAGSGWAKSILFNPGLKDMFAAFFARPDTFALGVCNGCQMLSQLKDIIPGAQDWPVFSRNKSEQFEARLVTVEVLESPSVLLCGMAGSRLGIPVAHGEGLADFRIPGSIDRAIKSNLATLRYIDNLGKATQRYPFNPNGSPLGITGLTTPDGRVTIMMPHPERAFRNVQLSYRSPQMIGEAGPWLKLFQNARNFCG